MRWEKRSPITEIRILSTLEWLEEDKATSDNDAENESLNETPPQL